jgi:hypothetical protein
MLMLVYILLLEIEFNYVGLLFWICVEELILIGNGDGFFRILEAWFSSLVFMLTNWGKMWLVEVILEGLDWDFVVDFLFNDMGVGFGFN